MTRSGHGPDGLHVALPADPLVVPRARRLVRERLREWRLHHVEDATLLVVSELVTNALRHGCPPVELRVEPCDGRVRVEVHDGARDDLPVVEVPTLDSVNGRGMRIVDALTRRWGAEVVDRGKRVWAEIDGIPASSPSS